MTKKLGQRVLVAVPTFNERNNVVSICKDILSVLPNADVVVIDDASPDGTGQLVTELARKEPRLRLIARSAKLGIGSAHQVALEEALRIGADVLVTLDADHTHKAEDIPRMLNALTDADVAVGSRFVTGGGLENWTIMRRLLTHSGHIATRALLRIPYDATGALRAYRVEVAGSRLTSVILNSGYSWFYESLTILHRDGARITEVPITLTARTYGSSKMRISDVLFGALNLFTFGFSKTKSKDLEKCQKDDA